jgi:hypothetical protein
MLFTIPRFRKIPMKMSERNQCVFCRNILLSQLQNMTVPEIRLRVSCKLWDGDSEEEINRTGFFSGFVYAQTRFVRKARRRSFRRDISIAFPTC